MMLLIQTAIIFFGTLMAAALVALGEPARADFATATGAGRHVSPSVHQDAQADPPRVDFASSKSGFSVR